MKEKFAIVSHHFEITQETVPAGWSMPNAHFHKHYEIYILESGQRDVTIQDTVYRVGALDATLFKASEPHRSTGQSPFQGICVHFNLQYLQKYFSVEAIKELMACFEHPVIHLDRERFAMIKSMADNFDYHAVQNFALLAMTLTLLSQCAEEGSDISRKQQNTSLEVSKYDAVIDFLHENYTDIHCLEEVADSLCVSVSYIYKITKLYAQMTPKQYINQLRVQHACRRLRYTEKSVHQVAEECGYSSYEYFVRVFKKQMGCTPKEFRDREPYQDGSVLREWL